MSDLTLIELPEEILPHIAANLEGNEVDSLHLTSKRMRNTIGRNAKACYKRRRCLVDVSGKVGGGFTIALRKKFGNVLIEVVDGICHVRKIQNGRSLTIPDEQYWIPQAREHFDGLTVEECAHISMQRCGSLYLRLFNELSSTALITIEPLLKRAHDLFMMCRVPEISKELAFELLYLPKRPLHMGVYDSPSPEHLNDGRFWREAACDSLHVNCYEHAIHLTDEDLSAVVSRSDLQYISVDRITGPSLTGIRATIQMLIHSKMECHFKIHGDFSNMGLVERVLREQINDEFIQTVTDEDPGTEILLSYCTRFQKLIVRVYVCELHIDYLD